MRLLLLGILVCCLKLHGVFFDTVVPLRLAVEQRQRFEATWEHVAAPTALLFAAVAFLYFPTEAEALVACVALTAVGVSAFAASAFEPAWFDSSVASFAVIGWRSVALTFCRPTFGSRGIPVARFRIVANVLAQLLSVASLMLPQLMGAAAVQLTVFGVSCIVCIACLAYTYATHHQPRRPGHEKSFIDEEDRSALSFSVQPRHALTFVVSSVVGLNAEQFLDSSLKLFLKRRRDEGDSKGLALNHILTAVARLFAFGSSAKSFVWRPTSLMLMWGIVQMVRLATFEFGLGASNPASSSSNGSGVWQNVLIGFLILIDKYAGSMGEIALEQALLEGLKKLPRKRGSASSSSSSSQPSTLSSSSSLLFIPCFALFSLFEPIQSITAALVKIATRRIVHSNVAFAAIVCVLSVASVYVVKYWSDVQNKGSTKKD